MSAVRALLLLFTTLLLLAAGTACTSLESGQAEAQAAHQGIRPERSEPVARARPSRETRVYRNAYRICTVFDLREMAVYYGAARRPRAVARAHAMELYSDSHMRREAVQGCLAALREG
jgi:hypothetical protein